MSNIQELIKGKTKSEGASIKSVKIARLALSGEFTHENMKVNIVGATAIEGGIEVYVQAYKGSNQVGFGAEGDVDVERIIITNPPLLVDDPLGTVVLSSVDEKGNVSVRRLREDPVQALKEVLLHVINIVGKDNTRIESGKVGKTTYTFYPAVDGRTHYDIYPSDDTWANMIAFNGNGFADSDSDRYIAGLATFTNSNKFAAVYHGWLKFNTSSLPDTDSISSATLSIWPTEVASALGGSLSFVEGTVASTTNLAATDHLSYLTTKLATDWAYSGIGTGAYKNAALNASGITAISKTGYTTFCLIHSNNLSGVAPTWASDSSSNMKCRLSEFAGTSSDPMLVIEAAPAGSSKFLMMF